VLPTPPAVLFLESAAVYLKDLGDEAPTKSTTAAGHRTMVALSAAVFVVVSLLILSAPRDKAREMEDGRIYMWKVPFFITAWMGLSAGLTIFNKWLFVPTGGNFPRISTLTWMHMLTAAVMTQFLRVARPDLMPAASKKAVGTRQIVQQLIPISCLQALVLFLGNTAYLYLSVSYIQMIKATMPAMVFVLSVLVGLEKFSAKESVILVILGIGTAGCSLGELNSAGKGSPTRCPASFVRRGVSYC